MLDFILNMIFWTLAFYGLFEIIKNIVYMYTYTKFKSNGTYLIIVTKNQENEIENFLRTLVFKVMYSKEDCIKNIMVSDLNSTDNTKEIIKKMAKDNESLKFLNWKDCKDIIDNINEK